MESAMIKIVYAADLFRRPILAASMFRDRTLQFRERLGWDVATDDRGLEFDQYDDLNPIYVIIEGADGEHLGSGRIMPTTGRTMIAEHFSDLAGGVALSSPLIWEITRFCVSPRLSATGRDAVRAPAALMWAGCDLALRAGVEFCVGVFNAPMLRVYKAIGFAPEVLGSRMTAEGEICGGLWEITEQARDRLAERAGAFATGGPCYFPSSDRFPFRPGAVAPDAGLIDPAVAAAALGRSAALSYAA
jgi:acyl homoserine lactone synthase